MELGGWRIERERARERENERTRERSVLEGGTSREEKTSDSKPKIILRRIILINFLPLWVVDLELDLDPLRHCRSFYYISMHVASTGFNLSTIQVID
jgi:hypothetical protein